MPVTPEKPPSATRQARAVRLRWLAAFAAGLLLGLHEWLHARADPSWLLFDRLGTAIVLLAGMLACLRSPRGVTPPPPPGLPEDPSSRAGMPYVDLAAHLQQAREEERAHLARELHDELGALLTAAKFDVARLKSRLGPHPGPETLDRLQHLSESLNAGIALKRRIVEDLRPSALAHLGLTPTLEILARDFAARTGLAVTTHLDPLELDDARQLAVYRLVQEALTNISRHAQAGHVTIGLLDGPERIEVRVQDDGTGFDPKAIRAGAHGLAGMRHRVEIAGGQFQVDTRAGAGTRIRALLPKAQEGDSRHL